MVTISVCDDLEAARRLWDRYWPQSCLFDVWDVRACFQEQFAWTPHFLVAANGRTCCGLMALSWIEEEQYYGHFPGEVWRGKTWLEQNKIPVSSPEISQLLWEHIPAAAEIRYLSAAGGSWDRLHASLDEVGFLFYPPQFNYSFQTYQQQFSGKSRKKIRQELNRLETHGISYRHDCFADIEKLFHLNLESFGDRSYFSDRRFLNAFAKLAAWLHDRQMLRVTTVLIGGEVAAVDVGAVWHSTYTVLAGGAHADFPGVAKLINLHHMEWACRQRFTAVDFLCGDFNWKNRFHLTPRPLYQIKKAQPRIYWQTVPSIGRMAYAG